MGFSSQEYWNGVLVPYAGYLPDPVIEPMSLALGGRFFNTELPGKPTLKLLNSLLDSVGEGEGEGGMVWENGIETCILSYVKQIASPGSMHDTGCSGWCTRMTQRDGMGREVGVGFRMGNTCTPVADSCQCMTKPIQYCIVISLQNINKVKKKRLLGEVSITLDTQMTPPLWQKAEKN